MSEELLSTIVIVITVLTVGISLGALLVTLMVRQEKSADQRFDRLETRIDSMDERLRHLEQGQAHLSGELSALKDFFVHRLGPE